MLILTKQNILDSSVGVPIMSRQVLFYTLLYFFPFCVYSYKKEDYPSLLDACLKVDMGELEKYILSQNLSDVSGIDVMVGELKCAKKIPFGALTNDWLRLSLLHDALPSGSILKEQLPRVFRILVIAYRNMIEVSDSHSLNIDADVIEGYYEPTTTLKIDENASFFVTQSEEKVNRITSPMYTTMDTYVSAAPNETVPLTSEIEYIQTTEKIDETIKEYETATRIFVTCNETVKLNLETGIIENTTEKIFSTINNVSQTPNNTLIASTTEFFKQENQSTIKNGETKKTSTFNGMSTNLYETSVNIITTNFNENIRGDINEIIDEDENNVNHFSTTEKINQINNTTTTYLSATLTDVLNKNKTESVAIPIMTNENLKQTTEYITSIRNDTNLDVSKTDPKFIITSTEKLINQENISTSYSNNNHYSSKDIYSMYNYSDMRSTTVSSKNSILLNYTLSKSDNEKNNSSNEIFITTERIHTTTIDTEKVIANEVYQETNEIPNKNVSGIVTLYDYITTQLKSNKRIRYNKSQKRGSSNNDVEKHFRLFYSLGKNTKETDCNTGNKTKDGNIINCKYVDKNN